MAHKHPTSANPQPEALTWHDPVQRIALVGTLANASLAFVKLTSGWLLGSKALEADGWHSFGDLATDGIALVVCFLASRTSKTDSRNGVLDHVEGLVALVMSTGLLLGGLTIWWDSSRDLIMYFAGGPLGKGHASHHHDSTPSMQAVWPALLTVLVKEWLYNTTMKLAQQRNSSILASKAAHDRADGLTSVVTMVTIFGANVLTRADWLDSVGSVAICVMVVKAACDNIYMAVQELLK
ncbi:hypothetical protein S40288_02292 [Stachybotrys chartarum IBT 40288]|nr:hypothetical protein S40288_02292 [Stachybotrys chartarum IBT 40288]